MSLLDPHLLILDQPRWWIWLVIYFDASHVQIDPPVPLKPPSSHPGPAPADEYDWWFILTPLTFKLIRLSLLDPHLLILDQPPIPLRPPSSHPGPAPVDEYDRWFILTPLTFKLIRLSNWSNCYPSRLTGYHGNQGWLICNLIQMSYKWFLSLHPSLTLSVRGRTLVVRIWRL